MRMYDIIKKKRDGYELTSDEIDFVIKGYVNGKIPDYQMAAFLMAVYFQKMSERETYDLTISMANSGKMLDLSSIDGFKIDKHSTGGVGDKTTLVVLPMVACFGLKIAKMSGRGLGHTGGTIDKLESIPGMRTNLKEDEFYSIVRDIGFSIAGQTGELVPADKKIYALRDATATVDNISLIASSIVSKKLAGGADGVIFDVKVGSGAFLKTVDEARRLANLMINILRKFGRKASAVLSNMDQPLGRMVGNSLEVIEAIETLKGKGPDDFTELCLILCREMLDLAGLKAEEDEIYDTIHSGKALGKFADFLRMQGGNPEVIENYDLLPVSSKTMDVRIGESGYVNRIDAELIGVASMLLGAGRVKKEDEIDPGVGLEVLKKVGNFVEANEPVARIYVSEKSDIDSAIKLIKSAYKISNDRPQSPEILLEVIK
ncbi:MULTISPECIES: thymidine phosphorylase [Pseudothermotoga]|uniref:Pyrimidine-nucleoside phosphorylase n=1 Tax=Pseudothermotoga lettingae (strain ATCC BAA-301 / DSM 14385 / NBRC 107922 / TMO) TaxID=416591 RepID=A8F5X0_PSELT|nr:MULTISPECIES: thymidine phosphorylase [Pseudothermotoga]ABV33554.1 pyrimidine-nucleoside phosphorylase [Pseudothermotoga lettingae TMO]KUK20094.1 MAG: Pyrimidine-nucleoside phosphorylase [Pseudothermotoga lettingae]MDI3495557.1 pyrimidine-nucleoside phosphorylase [Pseudothermotoga sp.]MDK2883798.1 pyrimidine-nucleoside phosphorylase [Pseudothermotoga sp.]GLI49532.1 pyrimidine-nucleoside phosphorylase [Pseudothermotoga lettingae TMO]